MFWGSRITADGDGSHEIKRRLLFGRKAMTNLLLLLVSRFSRVRLCATPETAAHQAPPSLGFSRQEHWSGLPFPSPMQESEKVGLKLNIQNTKVMASGPITSWQIDGETVERVSEFTSGGSRITAAGDCSHEIKRCLLLGRKVMTNLDSIFKSRKVHLVKSMVFPVVK